MSYSNTDYKAIRDEAALDLLRHKALISVSQGYCARVLAIEDVNEILAVAGRPVIIPDEVNAHEVNVIKVDKEETEEVQEDDTL